MCPNIIARIISKMKWTGPAARINTQARQSGFCFINYQRNLRPLQAHRNAWKLTSDPASVTGHRVTLVKMSHNFLSKPTHETNVNTIGRLPLPEHYLYKRLVQLMEKKKSRSHFRSLRLDSPSCPTQHTPAHRGCHENTLFTHTAGVAHMQC